MSKKWYTIRDLLLQTSKIREASYRGIPAREGQLVRAESPFDRVKVIFPDTGEQWADPRNLDYWIDGEWVYGQGALSVSPDNKTMMYQIEDSNDPDVGYVVYPTRDEALRAFDDLLETLWPDAPITWHIKAIEMTPEEFEALPEFDR